MDIYDYETEQLSLLDDDEPIIPRSSKKYKENCLERSERENVKYKIEQFQQLQNMPYEMKIKHARFVAKDFYKNVAGAEMYANCHVSVGGLDSNIVPLKIDTIQYNSYGCNILGRNEKYFGNGTITLHPNNKFGIEWYLTREEAEKALAERSCEK